jgi:hypothetical protein
VRVPFADLSPIAIPNGMSDEQSLYLVDIFPAGWIGPRTAKSNRTISSSFGVVVPSASSASKALCAGQQVVRRSSISMTRTRASRSVQESRAGTITMAGGEIRKNSFANLVFETL